MKIFLFAQTKKKNKNYISRCTTRTHRYLAYLNMLLPSAGTGYLHNYISIPEVHQGLVQTKLEK